MSECPSAGSHLQSLLAPSGDNRWDGRVGVGFAFLVERAAANGDERNPDGTEYDDGQKDRSKNDEEFFHARALGLTRIRRNFVIKGELFFA